MISPKLALELETKWNAGKVKLKASFPELTDEELDFDQTRKHEMLLKLQIKLGRTTREIQAIMDKYV